MHTPLPIIAVTVGEPAGVGPEIVCAAAADAQVAGAARVCVIGEASALRAGARALNIPLDLDLVADPARGAYAPGTVTLIDTAALTAPPPWGTITADGGAAAFAAIKEACRLACSGAVHAVATAPIHKECLRAARVPYIDHTTMLAGLTGAADVMTMFATRKLRVVFLTRHLALRDVPDALTVDLVCSGILSAERHLRSLGFRNPTIAVAALNPHGGEHGLFGTEEDEIITPGIARAQARTGARIVGPVPADAVFHKGAEGAYDAVLSMYHDQGHIATKTLDFHGTVSFTLGLPFLRTSVDHGTAFDIAGKGVVNAHAMVQAILAAAQFAHAYRADRV